MKIDMLGRGVCAREADIEIVDGVITKMEITGGCPGWSKAAPKLAVGRNVIDVIEAWKGIDCNNRGTSCAAELSKVLELL